MNCLKFETIKEYLNEIRNMNKENWRDEFEKSLYLTNHIELEYNILRSHIYLEFIEPLDSLVRRNKTIDYQNIEKVFLNCAKWCKTYLDISYVIQTHDNKKQEKGDVSEAKLFEAIKLITKQVFRQFNSLVDLCITAKNYALYLAKKILDKSNYDLDQFAHFEGEIDFTDDSIIKDFENKQGLTKSEPKELIKEVIESLIFDIHELDWSFSYDALEEDLKTLEKEEL